MQKVVFRCTNNGRCDNQLFVHTVQNVLRNNTILMTLYSSLNRNVHKGTLLVTSVHRKLYGRKSGSGCILQNTENK